MESKILIKYVKIKIKKRGVKMYKSKPDKTKHLGLVINPELHSKFKYISYFESRTIHGQLIHLICKCVSDFEKEYGVIKYNPDNENEI